MSQISVNQRLFGAADAMNNLLKNAPHMGGQTASDVSPPVARVDNVFGDLDLVCSCVGMENYQR